MARKSDKTTDATRRRTSLPQSDTLRRSEPRVAPPRYAERQHARPGAGVKRSKGAMLKRSR